MLESKTSTKIVTTTVAWSAWSEATDCCCCRGAYIGEKTSQPTWHIRILLQKHSMCVCGCVYVCGTATKAASLPDCQIANINVSGTRSIAQQSMLQGFSFLMLPLGLRFHTPFLPLPLPLFHPLLSPSSSPAYFCFLHSFFCVILFLFSGFSMRRNHSGVEICEWSVCACVYVHVCVCVFVCKQMIWKSCITDLVLLLSLSLLSS